MTLFVVLTLAAMGAGVVSANVSRGLERREVRDRVVAETAARSALAQAWFQLEAGVDPTVGGAAPEERVRLTGADVWVEATDSGGTITLTSTAISGRSARRMRLEANRTWDTLFRWAAFGAEGLVVQSNARTNSYDSRLGPLSWANHGEEGDVGSNLDVLVRQNADIQGSVHTGQAGSLTQLNNSEIEGGHHVMASDQELPPIEVPSFPLEGDMLVSGMGNVWDVRERAVGDFVLDHNSELLITGPAQIVCNTFLIEQNSELWIDGSAGPVEIFVIGDFLLQSNARLGSTDGIPSHLVLNLVSDNVIDPDQNVDLDQVDFDSNTIVWAAVYAPNAEVRIDSNLELFGSLVARRVVLDSNCQIHYDEALMAEGPGAEGTWEVASCLAQPVPRGER